MQQAFKKTGYCGKMSARTVSIACSSQPTVDGAGQLAQVGRLTAGWPHLVEGVHVVEVVCSKLLTSIINCYAQ